MELEVYLTLLHINSGGNRTLNLSILSPMPNPLGSVSYGMVHNVHSINSHDILVEVELLILLNQYLKQLFSTKDFFKEGLKALFILSYILHD